MKSQDSFNAPLKPKTTKKKSEDDDWDKPSNSVWAPWRNVTTAAIPNIAALTLRSFLGVTIALYVLNQKHLLPQPLSAVVSKALFWPTLPITASRRIGKWTTTIDKTVSIGGAPFGFLGFPEQLYEKQGVSNSPRYMYALVFSISNERPFFVFETRFVVSLIFVRSIVDP